MSDLVFRLAMVLCLFLLFSLSSLGCIGLAARRFTVEKSSQLVLDTTDSFRIRGSGFSKKDLLEFYPLGSFKAPVQWEQFDIKYVDGAGVGIQLLQGQR